MSENEKLVLELSKKSACGAVQVAISGLETHNYLLARAAGDLALVNKFKVDGPESERMRKAQSELQSHSNDIKKLQEKLLATLNGLRPPATST